jgi:transcriptional regulator of acetoin/glycerol metabolism
MHFLERLILSATERNISISTVKKYLEDREYDSASDFLPMETSAQSEERRIKDALDKTNSNIKKTAELLGMNRSTLYRKLSSFNIEIKKKY